MSDLDWLHGQFIEKRNSAGQPYLWWEPAKPMTRIPDVFARLAVFIYPDEDAARESMGWGGSGLLLAVPFGEGDSLPHHRYVVTNRHVVADGGVIRISGTGIPTTLLAGEWMMHPDGDDLAIARIPPHIPVPDALLEKNLLTPEIARERGIGTGEEVFMIGRFIGLDGHAENEPIVRFGALAVANTRRVRNRHTGLLQESFLVEMHSLAGYSGSPVMVWIAHSRAWGFGRQERVPGAWLLGIDWGHIRRTERVMEQDGSELVPTVDEMYVQENTGMAQVVPAWKIRDLLNMEELVKEREQIKRRWEQKENKAEAVTDATVPPLTKDDFEAALRKVSRKQGRSE